MNSVSVFLFCVVFSLKSYEVSCEPTVMYTGCYQGASLRVTSHNSHRGLTNELCNEACFERRHPYAGTMNGVQCFCSRRKPPEHNKTEESNCSIKCPGDESKFCGGHNTLSVFSTGAPEPSRRGEIQRILESFFEQIPELKTLSFSPQFPRLSFETCTGGDTDSLKPFRCYEDSRRNRVLPNQMYDIGLLTNQKCIKICKQGGYRYAGTENGRQCFCGNTEPSAYQPVEPEECNKPCLGNIFETCGGRWRLAVYSTNYIPESSVTPVPYTTPKPCDTSETVVTGDDKVCRSTVIFEDQFKTPLDTNSRWKHVVMIPDHSELEFVVFNSNPKNSFISETGLVIRPTVFNDSFVQTGSFYLNGCTESVRESQCRYQATAGNILPPVESARLQTRESFSFRYGTIEIRAKLPIGDWLVPELWLEPQSRIYGPGYASGRIRVAMNRGNVDLKCNTEDLGSNLLESGVVMGLQDNVRRRSLMTKLPDNWHSSFHNYTLKWTPDKISFQVDDEQPQELLPESWKCLCEVVGFENSECLTWNSGDKIAPFDQDFYISLGLTVGNARDFPDGCINGGKQKPWRNSDEKAMLKFWQDRENWKQTWTEEGSSLYIEHIRVTAL